MEQEVCIVTIFHVFLCIFLALSFHRIGGVRIFSMEHIQNVQPHTNEHIQYVPPHTAEPFLIVPLLSTKQILYVPQHFAEHLEICFLHIWKRFSGL